MVWQLETIRYQTLKGLADLCEEIQTQSRHWSGLIVSSFIFLVSRSLFDYIWLNSLK